MADRSAPVVLENQTGSTFKFQVLHQYTGDNTEQSEWVELTSGQSAEVLTVHYRTGAFTTGVDNWIVNGIERREVSASMSLPPPLNKIEIDGKFYVDLRWASGTGVFSDWKVHTLRAGDDGQNTTIVVFPNTVEFRSPSGNSSTGWNPEYEII
jgi:hypothetical protein